METLAEHSRSEGHRATAFPTTQWSLVLQAGAGEEPMVRHSLETLCRLYWFPVYTFSRRQGHAHHAAEDLTQGFFAHLLATTGLAGVTPERGRFRTFLLAALRNYSTSEWRRACAAKRGGGDRPLPLELKGAEERFAREPPDPGFTPEQAFDRNWALGLIQQAVEKLRAEYAANGHAALFAAMLPHAFGEAVNEPQAVAAKQLGLNEHAFTVAVSRLRKKLRVCLRSIVADTVARPEETDDELRILLEAIRQRPATV